MCAGPGSKPKGKPAKLPAERTFKADGGFKVTVAGRKGFDLGTTVRVLREVLAQVEARMEPAEGQAAA